jgi:hypothetical protein
VDFWKINFFQTWGETWSSMGKTSLVIIVFIFAALLLLVSKRRGSETGHEWIIDGLISFAVMLVAGAVVFVFCMLFVSPVQIYHDQKGIILGQTSLNVGVRIENQKLKAAESEIKITFLVQNSNVSNIVIDPKFSGEFTESIAGREATYGIQSFLLFPKTGKVEPSAFIIPTEESREFEVTIPDDSKPLYQRGAADFRFTLTAADSQVAGTVHFNKDSIETQPAIINFKN